MGDACVGGPLDGEMDCRDGRLRLATISVQNAGRLRASLLGLVALLSLALIAMSLWRGAAWSRPIPFYDQWDFVSRIPDILSGRFGFADLIAQHNEHRIATARLVFLLDLGLADGTGYASIAVLYMALAAIAALLSRGFAGDRSLRTTSFLLFFGLLASPAQWENLSSGFQVQFPLVDLFALLSLSSLIAALVAPRGVLRGWASLSVASLFDLLAVFSMASGVLLMVPALWIGVVLRSSPRRVLAFIVLHAVWCGLFFLHYVRPAGATPVLNPILIAQYSIVYLGGALRGYAHGPFLLGLLDVLGLAVALVSMPWRSRGGPAAVDRIQLFAAAVALLLLANAGLTASGRAGLGVALAVSSRYALQSLLFQAALFIVLWRESRLRLGAGLPRAVVGSGLLTGLLALSLLTNLSPASIDEWRTRVDLMDRAGFALGDGVLDDWALGLVYPEPGPIRASAAMLASRRLGPFSARFGGAYRPPLNGLAGTDPATAPACSASLSFRRLGPDRFVAEGWAFDPAAPAGDGWVVALDRSDGDRVVGFGRQSQMRGDVDRALGVSIGRSGFAIAMRSPLFSGGDPHSLALLLIPERADRPICASAAELDLAP